MPLTVYIEAESITELRKKMQAMLGDETIAVPRAAQPATNGHEPPPQKEEEEVNQAPAPAKKAAPPKAKKVVAREPEPEPEPEREPEPEELADEEDIEPFGAQTVVELEKVKEAQLARLKELFTSGRTQMIRDLLKKYGNGAKVFPEVDAAQFPAIKRELDAELGAS